MKKYSPTKEEEIAIKFVYDEFTIMRDVMTEQYREFNDRTLAQFLDDSQKRANSYVPSREEQGKEEWQANVFTPTTRNKVKAHIASVSKTPPDITITAYNPKNQVSVLRGEVMTHLVHESYTQVDNPEMTIFYDGWDGCINGTKIKYDGYLKVKNKVKLIKNYDLITGVVEYEEKDEIVEDRPIELEVPVQNFFVKNAYILNVQDQPAVAWVEYYDEDRYDYEFGDYKNAKYAKTQGELLTLQETTTFFGDQWMNRMKGREKMYEVVRYYNKSKDIYRIVVNGVLILDSPLLWGRRKKKYPFAKTIYEPFANSLFFWGNSLPNILMAEQDVQNALVCSLTDKTFRSMNPQLLIGLANRDAFDLEDEFTDSDTKIYVDDVSQVTQMPVPQVNQSELAMLNMVRAGLDRDSTDQVQGGTGGSGSTAREIVIANERAEELKGLFFTFLKDLWLQKTRLRVLNIQMNYNRAKVEAIVGEDGADTFEEMFKTFHVPRAKLSNGKIGNIMVEVVKDKSKLSRPGALDVREEMARLEGRPVEIVQITSDYLDDHEYDCQIETDSLFQKARSLKMALIAEKIQGVATFFPDIFMASKDKFFRLYMEGFGDDPNKYLESMPQMGAEDPMMAAMMSGPPGQQSSGGSMNAKKPEMGQMATQITSPTKSLGMLA